MNQEETVVAEAIRAALHPSEREVVEVLAVRRLPGVAAAVLVRSADVDVDPVGAVVGMKGHRIQEILAVLPPGETISLFEARGHAHATAQQIVLQTMWDDATQAQRAGAVCIDPDRAHLDVVLAAGVPEVDPGVVARLGLGAALLGMTVTVRPDGWEPEDLDDAPTDEM